jgi:hypothetical protein
MRIDTLLSGFEVLNLNQAVLKVGHGIAGLLHAFL